LRPANQAGIRAAGRNLIPIAGEQEYISKPNGNIMTIYIDLNEYIYVKITSSVRAIMQF
jgi:hypothetical protein